MLSSMTGFARLNFNFSSQKISLEIRSVNQRFLETAVYLPFSNAEIENKIRKIIEKNISRGKVVFSLRGDFSKLATKIKINKEQVKTYVDLSKSIQEEFDIPNGLDSYKLLSLSGVIQEETEDGWQKEFMISLEEAMSDLLKKFIDSRQREGKSLVDSIQIYNKNMKTYVKEIEGYREEIQRGFLEKMRAKIEKHLESEIDENRLAMEVSILLEKMDIEEEMVRLDSHLSQLDELLALSEPVGKKMNFLAQELNREINTIGSKSNHCDLVNCVINFKTELERFREQIQNLE